VKCGTHCVSSCADRPSNGSVGGPGSHEKGSEVERIFNRCQCLVLRQTLRRTALVKVLCQFLFARVSSRIGHIDSSTGEFVMDTLTLIEGTEQCDLTPVGCSQLASSLDDPRVVALGECNPSANGHRPCFKIFEKPHHPSPPDIVAYRH
jgi:hypothetical protein